MRLLQQLPILAAMLTSCASSGTRPHDMSAAEHRAAAAEEERQVEEHEGRQYPNPSQVTGCGSATAAERTGIYDICWSTTTAAAQEHDNEAARHRDAAAKHRAAAVELERAETTSCQGVAPNDRDISPFYHRQDVLSTSEVPPTAGALGAQLRGARVVFRKVAGLTKASLQRLVDCHMARAASVGHQMPEMAYCPLVLRGVEVSVTEATDGLAIEITSTDRTVAHEIVERVRLAASQ